MSLTAQWHDWDGWDSTNRWDAATSHDLPSVTTVRDLTPRCMLCGGHVYLVPFPVSSVHSRKWICGGCLDELVEAHGAADTSTQT